jgi:transcription initiation factor IIE alpha subunit
MGAELLKFTGTFEKTHYLKEFQCPQCRQPITEQDITEKNYQL